MKYGKEMKKIIMAMVLQRDDLSKNGEQFKSPDWHHDVLAQRESVINDGSAQYVNWETAKKMIKDQCE